MTNSDWWDRAKTPPRPQPIEICKGERLYELHRDAHEITLEKRDVPAIGEELILSVNGQWRRMRVFRSGVADVSSGKDSSEARGAGMAAVSDLDPVMVGEPLWTLQKDGHTADARVRAIP